MTVSVPIVTVGVVMTMVVVLMMIVVIVMMMVTKSVRPGMQKRSPTFVE